MMPFSIERKIGEGAYAEVFLARRAGRNIVVKRARSERRDHVGVTGGVFFAEGRQLATGSAGVWSPSPNEVLAAEARVLARVSHPAMVKLESSGMEAGLTHLVLEHIGESNWREALNQRRVTLAHFIELLDALAAMAASGELAVHGDIKPENLMLEASGRVRILDPTSGSIVRDAAGRVQSLVTTLWYNPTLRANDIASLGLLLFEVLTGRHLLIDTAGPLPASDRLRAALSGLENIGRGKWFSRCLNMQRPHDLGVAVELESAILRCLGLRFDGDTLDLGDTYSTAAELRAQLR